ncbi:hypothetical protein ACFODZ_11730 [Marinicella sediminis]|uniref:Uncharacterized protein n=1 Tax=Marinicella sediminis TaxID=1792834 RepID=A0ABV7J9U9_9GAMM|nr:hypothetical protein [Marinicella sediminis]
MQYLIREYKELLNAWLAVLAFYLNPRWLTRNIARHNAIEHTMGVVKKSIATMVLSITILSLFFGTFEFVQEHEKPAEIFAVLFVHGALVSAILAVMFWLWLRDHHQVGMLVGWFMLVYWVPLWFWNMAFEIHVGFSGGQHNNLFLQLAHQEVLSRTQGWLLMAIWLHATIIAIYGLHRLLSFRHVLIWVFGLLGSVMYLASFLMVHHIQKGVEIVYLMFGME